MYLFHVPVQILLLLLFDGLTLDQSVISTGALSCSISSQSWLYLTCRMNIASCHCDDGFERVVGRTISRHSVTAQFPYPPSYRQDVGLPGYERICAYDK